VSTQAGEVVGRIAEELWQVVSPGDQLHEPRLDVPPEADQHLRHGIALLGEAEKLLAPGIGRPDDAQGETVVRQAIQELELATKFGNLPRDVSQGRADAVRRLENEVLG
jgi:hypothetical protein